MIYNKLERKLFVRRKSSFYLKKPNLLYKYGRRVRTPIFGNFHRQFLCKKLLIFMLKYDYPVLKNQMACLEHEYFKYIWHLTISFI